MILFDFWKCFKFVAVHLVFLPPVVFQPEKWPPAAATVESFMLRFSFFPLATLYFVAAWGK